MRVTFDSQCDFSQVNSIYMFDWYVDCTDDDAIEILDEKPDVDAWLKISMRELLWWEYFRIQEQAVGFNEKTQMHTVNDITRRRLYLRAALLKLTRVSNGVSDDLDQSRLLPSLGEALARKYHAEKCMLTDDDKQKLSEDMRNYSDPEQMHKIKNPYSRIFVELDMMRHFGGYGRSDFYSMSKKDVDAIYFLRQLGLMWAPSVTTVRSESSVSSDQHGREYGEKKRLEELCKNEAFIARATEIQAAKAKAMAEMSGEK